MPLLCEAEHECDAGAFRIYFNFMLRKSERFDRAASPWDILGD